MTGDLSISTLFRLYGGEKRRGRPPQEAKRKLVVSSHSIFEAAIKLREAKPKPGWVLFWWPEDGREYLALCEMSASGK